MELRFHERLPPVIAMAKNRYARVTINTEMFDGKIDDRARKPE